MRTSISSQVGQSKNTTSQYRWNTTLSLAHLSSITLLSPSVAANMAATFLTAPLKLLFILVLLKYFLFDDYHCDVYSFIDGCASFWSLFRIKRGAFKPEYLPALSLFSWNKHSYTCIFLPSTTDITICMDVELNPGPFICPRSIIIIIVIIIVVY